MSDPRVIDGAPALLFERLIDLDPKRPTDARPFRILTPDEMKASIRRELERLLDTRRAIGVEASLPREEEEEMTVLDYGIPDFTTLSPGSVFDRRKLAEAIRRAVAAFEPRLLGATVRVEAHHRKNTVQIYVEGMMRFGDVMEPVSFPVAMNLKTAERAEADVAG